MTDQHTHTVTIYGSSTCTFCDKVKAFCVGRGIPFTYHDVDEDFAAFDALVAKIGQWKTVPQIFVGDRHAGGCDDFIAEYAKVETNADEARNPTRTYRCESGPPEGQCACYACHGG